MPLRNGHNHVVCRIPENATTAIQNFYILLTEECFAKIWHEISSLYKIKLIIFKKDKHWLTQKDGILEYIEEISKDCKKFHL